MPPLRQKAHCPLGFPMPELTISLPPLGDDAPDAARVSWIERKPGDPIAKGEQLLEMITDKATFDVPSPCDGRLVRFLVDVDEEVKVGQPICVLETP